VPSTLPPPYRGGGAFPKLRDFKLRDFRLRDFKLRDFKLRDFKLSRETSS